MVCFGNLFEWNSSCSSGNCEDLWPVNLIFFLLGDSVYWVYLCNFSLPILKGRKFMPTTEGLKKHVCGADGQVVIPPLSQAISQPVWQWAHEDMLTLQPLPQWFRDRVSWLWSFKAEMYRTEGGLTDWLKICTRQPWTFFFFFFTPSFCCPPLMHFLPPPKEKIKIEAFEKLQIIWNTFGLSYWNEVQRQLLRPLSDLVPNWLFHIRGPCSLCSHRAGMLDSTAATKATIYQLWLHTFWSIAPLNC